MKEKEPEFADVQRLARLFDSQEDRDLLIRLVEEGTIPSLKMGRSIIISVADALSTMLRVKGSELSPLRQLNIQLSPLTFDFENDLPKVLSNATDEDLFAFGKCVLVRKIAKHEFTLDFIKGSQNRQAIIDELEDGFLRIGSNLFERGSRLRKSYRQILYICARKLKGIPTYNRADTIDFIPKPYPESAVSEGITHRKLVHVDILPTSYMEMMVVTKLVEIIWGELGPHSRKTLFRFVMGDLEFWINYMDQYMGIHTTELPEMFNFQDITGDNAIDRITSLLNISDRHITGRGVYIFAMITATYLANAIGLPLPFSMYLSLSGRLSSLLRSHESERGYIFASTIFMKPNYRRLLPAISIVSGIRNRSKEVLK